MCLWNTYVFHLFLVLRAITYSKISFVSLRAAECDEQAFLTSIDYEFRGVRALGGAEGDGYDGDEMRREDLEAANDFTQATLLKSEFHCKQEIIRIASGKFGPPKAFEVFEATCKGWCQSYAERYRRIVETAVSPPCDCTALLQTQAHQFSCFTPTDYLCRFTGLCYEWEQFNTTWCATNACARWERNEGSWLAARRACGESHAFATFSNNMFTLTGVSALSLLLLNYHRSQ